MPGILVLSSTGLTDRMLVHTGLLRTLSSATPVTVWSTSAANRRFSEMWSSVPADVEAYPTARPYSEVPINYLRRIADSAWDFYLMNPTRLSRMHHIWDKSARWYMRPTKWIGRLAARLRLHQKIEDRVERMMVEYDHGADLHQRLAALRPDVVLSTGTFRYEDPPVVGAAKQLGIPVIGLITSWDNVSTKNRAIFKYDAYVVWSDRMEEELREYYPCSRSVPIYKVGAPQFDVFAQKERYVSREEFCRGLQLDAAKPIILDAMGIGSGVEEHYAALCIAERMVRGELGDAQLIVRPHPFNNHRDLREIFKPFGPRVAVQQSEDPSAPRNTRSQDEADINEWVNTFRHSDVVVHFSSTSAIDAALFDRPSVCLDYDPMPGQRLQALVREVNHRWTHYKPVAESGGTWLVNSPDELIAAIREYLNNPGLHRDARARMAKFVAGVADGRCGERLAESLLAFLQERGNCRQAAKVVTR